jgi:copper chaperone CopZ
MKKIFVIIAILFSLQSEAQVSKASLQASGLTCAMCSKAVYKALSAVPFVAKVESDIEKSTYELSFKNGSKPDFDLLSKAVIDAGFSVSALKVTAKFNDVKVQNNAHVTLGNQMFHFLDVTPQTLQGEKTISLIDKNFVTAKAYKKYEKVTTMACYQSGKMDGQRVYHVTL